ncbi:MAG TPA: anti-sigma factor [Candidatus Limnocylindrales bacterium]|nr:anti-sigma factor [Candidatus Limnocylindrales bacterium]
MNREPMSHDDVRAYAAGYLLRALEPGEEAAVRDHLATCPQPHPEFAELAGVIAVLVEDVELVEPPAALRDRIMEAARADLAERTLTERTRTERTLTERTRAERTLADAAPVPEAPPTPEAPPAPQAAPAPAPAAAPTAFPSAAEREIRRAARTSRLDWALRIAAVVAIVAAGAWGFGLQRQLDASRQFDQAVAAVIDAAGRPGAHSVILTPAEGKRGSGIAAVTSDGAVTLAMRDLTATSGGQVYTTWVIVGRDAPVSVGDFTVDANGTARFISRPEPTPPGAIIALTLEPNAGNTAPKGDIISTGVTPGATG